MLDEGVGRHEGKGVVAATTGVARAGEGVRMARLHLINLNPN